MYKNIKLIEEFEQELIKELLKEEKEADGNNFDFDNYSDVGGNDFNFESSVEDPIDDEPDERKETNYDGDMNDKNLVESAESMALKEIELKLDDLEFDDEEDFNGDGEDDIDPDELENMVIGFEDEIEELGNDEIEDDLLDDEKLLKENYNLSDILVEIYDEEGCRKKCKKEKDDDYEDDKYEDIDDGEEDDKYEDIDDDDDDDDMEEEDED